MLRLAANVRRSVGGAHHHRHLCPYNSSPQSSVAGYAAKQNARSALLPQWHRDRQIHYGRRVATNVPKLVFARPNCCCYSRRLLLPLQPQKGPSAKNFLSARGLASTSTASGTPPSGFIAWYLRMLSRYPLPTKSVTAANILAFADMTAQYLANMTLKEGERRQDWDKIRTLRMLGIGAFFTAPILHMWFNLMQRMLPKTDITSTVMKVLAGQLLASPVVNSAFFAVNSILQGESLDQAVEKIKRDLWPTWKSGAMYWPPLDFVTFRFVPVHLQVFFNNCCSFFWTIYLTSMAGKKAGVEKTENLAIHKPC